MERSANNRKRAREDDDHPAASVAKIKPDLINARGYYVHREFETTDKQHSFDSIFDTTETCYNNNNAACADVEEGLFDFPWLKEGMAFKAEDFEESDFDNIFVSSNSSSSTLQDASDSKAEEQNLCQFPKLLNFDDDDMKKKKKKNNYEDDLLPPSFQADQLEGPDWICSCVFD
ncbi:hypothetical protein RHGRI_025317 [Rhododendron griersonianum]|uniref:Uncharacterized protein n=1 Tax=Rhododendron griersonianum TaxID=479676 RepID=A0AAV6IP96_9ERIC|nr:hypothetical protein RHGRI_025317 [Rhododendron griersonianum]